MSEARDIGEPLPLPSRSGAGVPEWVHLVPAGAFTGRDGRSFRIRDMESVIAASLRLAVRGVLPLDYNHQLDLAKNGQEAPAAGWVTELQARSDGIWGRVEWTPRGRERVASREYRFISPVFYHAPNGEVMALLRAALTNTPNLAQLKALNSAGTAMDPEQMMRDLRSALALPADAPPEAILKAVRDLTTASNTPDPTRFVPMDMFRKAVAEANKANLGLALNEAQRVVDDAIRDRRVMPWMREWAVQLCTVNAPAFEDFVKGTTGRAINGFFKMIEGSAINRSPFDDGSPAVDEVSARLGLTAEDIKKYGS